MSESDLIAKQKSILKELCNLWRHYIKLKTPQIRQILESFHGKIESIYNEFKVNHNLITISQSSTEEYENEVVDVIVSLKDDFVDAIDRALNDKNYSSDGLESNFHSLCEKQFEVNEKITSLFHEFNENCQNASITFLKITKQQLDQLWGEFKENHSAIKLLQQNTSIYETALVDNLVAIRDDFLAALDKRLGKKCDGESSNLNQDESFENKIKIKTEFPTPITFSTAELIDLITDSEEEYEDQDDDDSMAASFEAAPSENPQTSAIDDFLAKNQSLCRICLETKENLVGITSSHSSGQTIGNLLETCSGLNLSSDLYLPQSVCTDCLKTLEMVLNFREKIHESDQKIKSKFNQVLRGSGQEDAKVLDTSKEKPIVQGDVSMDMPPVNKDQNRAHKRNKRKLKNNKGSKKSFNCDYCQRLIPSRKEALKHLEEVHNTRRDHYKCTRCDFFKKGTNIVYYHCRAHEEGYQETCPTCRETFTDKFSFWTHKRLSPQCLTKQDEHKLKRRSKKKFSPDFEYYE